MKRVIAILFLFSAIVLLLGGCAYYYPYGYDSYYYPENYGFIGPFYYYSPLGYYSSYPYPFYPEEYSSPTTRFYLGERPEDFRERHYESGERPGGEK